MAKKKKQKNVIPAELRDSAQKIWLAGLGAVAMAEEEGEKLFTSLVERGENFESRSKKKIKEVQSKVENRVEEARDKAESSWSKIEDTVDDRIASTLKRLGVPTRSEIQNLTKRVEELTIKIDRTKAAPKRATAAKAKPAAKPTAKRTTAKRTTAKSAEAGGEVVAKADTRSKVGIAMAGGGLEGAIYEIGALRAVDEAFDGIDLTDLDVYVGVSAGAFIASNLVNGLSTRQQCRAIVRQDPGQHPFVSEIFLSPAIGEIAYRAGRVPRLVWESLSKYFSNPSDRSLLDSLTRLGRALPVGVFDNEPIRAYLEKIYTLKGRTDDFRELRRPLFVVAVDLDSGEAVRFGEPGFDHVPISRAVQASSALPGIYPPVEIDGRHYVDGALVKTVHASVALDAGADLVLCINPIVPVDTRRAVSDGVMRRGKLIDRGWPSVISQTFRTVIHSRMRAGMASYQGRYGDAEVVLIEPRRTDYRMFFNNIFSFASRIDVCEHAYRATRRDLFERKDELAPKLARHGITLREDVLADPARSLWGGVGLGEGGKRRPVVEELDLLLDRLDVYVDSGAGG